MRESKPSDRLLRVVSLPCYLVPHPVGPNRSKQTRDRETVIAWGLESRDRVMHRSHLAVQWLWMGASELGALVAAVLAVMHFPPARLGANEISVFGWRLGGRNALSIS